MRYYCVKRADMSTDRDTIHADKVFWFIVYLTTFGFSYIVAITFIPIPKENLRFADTCIGFLLGTALTAGISYLLVSSPGKKRESATTSEISTTLTTTESSPHE